MTRKDHFPSELLPLGRTIPLEPGQILFQQGDVAEAVYWVRSGRLRLMSFSLAQVVTHYTVEVGDSFAETALYFESYGCTVMAEGVAQVIAIPVQEFLEALRKDPSLFEWYVAQLTHRFHVVKGLLELRSLRSARDRILHYLIRHTPPGHSQVVLDRPLKVLAGELGLTPEGLSRSLTRLQAEGLISRRKRSISIHHDRLG